ncbi:hypothetical protein P7C70_g9130, partial [Phenoliferia sp. Uapishka_3]
MSLPIPVDRTAAVLHVLQGGWTTPNMYTPEVYSNPKPESGALVVITTTFGPLLGTVLSETVYTKTGEYMVWGPRSYILSLAGPGAVVRFLKKGSKQTTKWGFTVNEELKDGIQLKFYGQEGTVNCKAYIIDPINASNPNLYDLYYIVVAS